MSVLMNCRLDFAFSWQFFHIHLERCTLHHWELGTTFVGNKQWLPSQAHSCSFAFCTGPSDVQYVWQMSLVHRWVSIECLLLGVDSATQYWMLIWHQVIQRLVGTIPLRMAYPIHSWGWEMSIQMEHALGEAWLILLLWVCVCMWCVNKSKVCGIRNVINLLTWKRTVCWFMPGGTNLN